MHSDSADRVDLPVPAYLLVARSVWLEISRREEPVALFILMGLYLLIALGARLVGNTQTEAVSFMLNMGLWLSSVLAAILTLLTGARLIPNEIDSRTLYPLLAKPVQRSEVIFGKFLAAVIAGWVVFSLFTLLTTLTWAATFPIPGQDLLMFLQALTLQLIAIALLCALAVLLSLILPKPVAILLTAFLYFGGSPVLNVIRSAFRDSQQARIIDWVLWYVPDFSYLCLLQRFTDGASALGWMEWFLLAGYGLLFTLVFLCTAGYLFEKRNV